MVYKILAYYVCFRWKVVNYTGKHHYDTDNKCISRVILENVSAGNVIVVEQCVTKCRTFFRVVMKPLTQQPKQLRACPHVRQSPIDTE